MTWPVPGYSGCIYQGFGSGHKGYDISGGGIYGAPIVAASSGTVIFAGYGSAANSHNRYGYCVDIDHGSGIATRYAHCSALTVSTGDYVTEGQVIGYVGATGYATGPHLDFRLKQNGKYVNPAKVVAPRGGSIPRNRMNDFKNRKALIGEYLSGKRSLSDYKR